MDVSVNDAFIPVSRYWDRINRPEQLLASLPEAMRVLTDQAETGAVTICLPQDVQTEGYDYPANFFAKRVHHISRVVPPAEELQRAVEMIRNADEAADHRRRRGALLRSDGRAVRLRRRPGHPGLRDPGREGRAALEPCLERGSDRSRTAVWPPIAWRSRRIWSSPSARAWPTSRRPRTPQFQNPDVRFLSINVSSRDAHKFGALPLVGDARATLDALRESPGRRQAPHRRRLRRSSGDAQGRVGRHGRWHPAPSRTRRISRRRT